MPSASTNLAYTKYVLYFNKTRKNDIQNSKNGQGLETEVPLYMHYFIFNMDLFITYQSNFISTRLFSKRVHLNYIWDRSCLYVRRGTF